MDIELKLRLTITKSKSENGGGSLPGKQCMSVCILAQIKLYFGEEAEGSVISVGFHTSGQHETHVKKWVA